MTFDEWWKQMKPAECDEVKLYFEEAWQIAFRDGYEKGVAAFHEAVAMEREACAAMFDDKAKALGEQADQTDDLELITRLKAYAWQMTVAAADIRKRSNV